MTKTIRIEDFDQCPEAELNLSGDRVVRIRRPATRPALEPCWAARRPGWGNPRAAADRLLRAALVEPEQAAAVAAELSTSDRHRLILAVVRLFGAESRWRGLYGTTLTGDERLVAIAVDAFNREAQEAISRLRETRRCLAAEAASSTAPAKLAALGGIGKSIAALNSVNRQLAGLGTVQRLLGAAALPKGYGVLGEPSSISKMLGAGIGTAAFTDYKAPSLAESLGLGAAHSFKAAFEAGKPGGLGATYEELGLGAVKAGFLDATKGWKGIGAGASLEDLFPALRGDLGIAKSGTLTGLFGAKSAAEIAGFGKLGVARFDLGFDVAKFGFQNSELLDIGRQWRRTLDTLLLAEFARVWGDHALWFLLRDLQAADVRELLDRDPAEVHGAVLDALERVLGATPVLEAIEAALAELAFLDANQREWLADGLEHLRHGRWVKSLPPLILGFEGAIYNGALDAEAWAITQGKEPAAEAVIKAIDLDEALRSFTIRLVFGGRGNAIRHGRPKNEAREQALLMVVAIVGWIDSVLGTNGAERLVEEIRGPLLGALAGPESRPALEPA